MGEGGRIHMYAPVNRFIFLAKKDSRSELRRFNWGLRVVFECFFFRYWKTCDVRKRHADVSATSLSLLSCPHTLDTGSIHKLQNYSFPYNYDRSAKVLSFGIMKIRLQRFEAFCLAHYKRVDKCNSNFENEETPVHGYCLQAAL